VLERRPRFEASREQREQPATRLFAAAEEGDLEGLEELLAHDAWCSAATAAARYPPSNVRSAAAPPRGEDAARDLMSTPGVYYVVDDEPAPARGWLPVLANALGAKPPRRVPRWLARLAAGEMATLMMTEVQGASNEKESASSAGSCGIRAGGRASRRDSAER
jgi:hypothetical protein